MLTTIGQIIVNDALPEKYRDYNRIMDKDNADEVLRQIAENDPEQYGDASRKLNIAGSQASFNEGATLRLRDLAEVTPNRKDVFKYISQQEDEIDDNDELSPKEKKALKEELYSTASNTLSEDTYKKALSKDNPFALQVKSRARGSKGQLSGVLSTPGTYSNHKGEMVPVFIKRSYAEGLRPEEYWAAAYGGRVGVISTKTSTAKGGYLGKLISSAAIENVVTNEDCETGNGIPVKAHDADNLGAVLARDSGPFKAGTIINRQVLTGLKKAKIDDIVIRSPVTCGNTDGVCQICTGQREMNSFPPIGYHLGKVSASAVAEKVAQQALNTKHSGKRSKGHGFSGYEVIKNFTQAPKNYPDRAAIAQLDGAVTKIEDAPQGGKNIWVGDQLHHALTGMDPLVKVGDRVEAGDLLSDGIGNPAEIVKHKGIGEGRRYFTDKFTQFMRNSGLTTNRRNIEALSRSIVDHVTIDDEASAGNYLVGDTVRYSGWSKGYKPREGYRTVAAEKAVGKYLESPALHYSIGTRITKSVSDNLKKYGINDIDVHDEPPGVTPEFQSVTKNPEFSEDWMGQLGSSYLEKRLLQGVHRGAESDIHGINPLPGIAKAVEFGTPPPGTTSPW